ncbi:MAG TPA: hypothetical protein VGR95_05685 [Thermoanaerobaculia bacterium]|jgi:hypothetical protein|nr:hypothetical protein [Thermoanaerobaculia bacterium]
MFNNIQGTLNTPTNPPTDGAKLTPEAVVGQLRAIRDQLPAVMPLTPQQRKTLRKRAQMPADVLQASISVLGASDDVSSAIKQPASDVNALQDETNRWSAVEDELKALWNGVSGANLNRRHRLALIATQAYGIGTQLAKDPANVLLVPHVQEVKRLKKAASVSRKKPPQTTPASSAPESQSAPQQQHTLDAPKVEA